ncbi:MAG: thioredoxin [Bacteroidales bacterium]|nr:thioredoxin [Bacteroidales bacterium]HQH42071.1 thioredoxin [Bacteroidales bacterium]HQK37259.1 thioredoxin [Bacteroidales bacterium]
MEVEITDSNFDQVVLQSDKPVMIDLWAEWCGPCRVIAPFVHEIAEEYQGKIVVGKMDVDENTQIPAKYGVRNIPTILFFKNGELVDKQVGAVPKNLLVGKVEALLK